MRTEYDKNEDIIWDAKNAETQNLFDVCTQLYGTVEIDCGEYPFYPERN